MSNFESSGFKGDFSNVDMVCILLALIFSGMAHSLSSQACLEICYNGSSWCFSFFIYLKKRRLQDSG